MTRVLAFSPGRLQKLLVLLNSVAFFLFCGGGVSYGGASYGGVSAVSNYYSAKGAAADVAVTRDGHIILALTNSCCGQSAGIQVYNPVDYNSCNNTLSSPDFPSSITTVYGIALFPERPHDLSKTGVGLAVDSLGGQFLRLVDLNTCTVDGAQNAPQPQPANAPPHAPGTFSLAVGYPFGPLSFAFLADEYGITQNSKPEGTNGTLGVVRTLRDRFGKFTKAELIAPNGYIYIPGANTLPGVTLSRDGRYLYLTHEGASLGNNNPTGVNNADLASTTCLNQYPQLKSQGPNGLLSVIDVWKAMAGWGQLSIIRTIAAGCSPVRALESEDGKVVFVATRGGVPCAGSSEASDPSKECIMNAFNGRILAFDAAKLRSRRLNEVNQSLITAMNSGGTAPVGMALLNRGRWLVVANSNRFYIEGEPEVESSNTNVAFLDVSSLKTPSVMTTCASQDKKSFPRGVTVGGRDRSTVYVANFGGCGGLDNCKDGVAGFLQVITTTPGQNSGCLLPVN